MVREICFSNSWPSTLAFFRHQNLLPLVTFHLKFQQWRLLRRNHNYIHHFVFGQAESWRWIPLHSSCIMHEHIFCLPDWGTFSNYHKSGSFHCYTKWAASVKTHHELVGYVKILSRIHNAVVQLGFPGSRSKGDRDPPLTNKVYLFPPQTEWLFHSNSGSNVQFYTISVCQG